MKYPKYERMTMEQWERTIAHDHQNPSRQAAFDVIGGFLGDSVLDLTELGFCSCWDFETQFKAWHDEGKVHYRGYDTCPQFVNYAKAKWPDYDWHLGSSEDMGECDVSYARHVAMTMAPDAWPMVLWNLLEKSRVACVVTYHYPPQDDDGYFVRHRRDGDGRDVWTNRYGKAQLMQMYDMVGFTVEMVSVGKSEVIYLARREGCI